MVLKSHTETRPWKFGAVVVCPNCRGSFEFDSKSHIGKYVWQFECVECSYRMTVSDHAKREILERLVVRR